MAKLEQKNNLKIKGAHFIYLVHINDMSKKLKDLENLTYLKKSYIKLESTKISNNVS